MNEITEELKTRAWVGGSFHKIRYTYYCTIVPSVFISTIAPWNTKQNWKTRQLCMWLLSLGRVCSGCYKGKELNNYDEAKNIAVCFDLVPKRVCVPSTINARITDISTPLLITLNIVKEFSICLKQFLGNTFHGYLSSLLRPDLYTGMLVPGLKDSHPSIILPSWHYIFYFTLTEYVWANKPVNS